MDIQLTDFENTALTVCVGMIANVINTFDLDFVLPVSLVDENMKRAHNRDGLLSTKFWWKVPANDQEPTEVAPLNQNMFLRSSTLAPSHGADIISTGSSMTSEEEMAEDQARYKELYVWQIFNGDESIGFTKGLL